MNFYSKIGLIILFVLTISNCFAQKDTANTYTESVVVVGAFNPQLKEFPKKEFNPEVKSEQMEKVPMIYSIFAQPMRVNYSISTIKPAKIGGEPFEKLYSNYIRAGFGNGITPYAELFLNNKRDKTKNYGLHLKHFSTREKIKEYAFTGNSNNQIDVFGSLINRSNTLSAKIFYNRDAFHYYGFKPQKFDLNISDKDLKNQIKQRYNNIGSNILWYSTHRDSTHFNYKTDFEYDYFWSIFNANEHSVKVNGFVNKQVHWLDKICHYQEIGLQYKIRHFFQNLKTNSLNAGIIELAPYISTIFGPIRIDISPRIDIATDSTSQVYVFSDINLELNLLPGTLSAFGGIDGGLEYNSYSKLAQTTPFIYHFIESKYSITKQTIYGGIHGNIGKSFSYNIIGSNKRVENNPLFVCDTTSPLGNWQTVVYDKQLNWFRSEFNANMKIKEKWDGILMFAYNMAEATSEAQAWNIPNIETMLGISYNLANKILIKTRIFYYGNRYQTICKADYKNINNDKFEFTKQKPYIDANLSLEYRYSKVLSAFLEFSNIAAQKYMIWGNYPSYRFRVLGGVTFSF